MTDPIQSFIVEVEGDSNSKAGDAVRVTIFTGETARGSVTGVLDSNKGIIFDLANSGISVARGDTIVASIFGSGIGSLSQVVTGGGADFSLQASPITTAAVNFPARML